MGKLFANSGDPDQTPHSAAFDLGLHWLPITLLQVSRLQWVIGIRGKAIPMCPVSNVSYADNLYKVACFVELVFNDTSTLVGHFVSSHREREKTNRRDSRRDEKDRGERKMNESEETEEMKTFPLYPHLLQW